MTRTRLPKAFREQVWLMTVGRTFASKCNIQWCINQMTVFDFHVGHNIPKSKGGKTDLSNLVAICARCNLSMGAQFSIREWSGLSTDIHIASRVKVQRICNCMNAWHA